MTDRPIIVGVDGRAVAHQIAPVTVVPRSLSAPGAGAVPAAVAGNPHDRSQLW